MSLTLAEKEQSLSKRRSGFFSAAVVAILCIVIAISGFFIIPPRLPKNPPQVLFESVGGPVLFPHAHHSDPNGGANACSECHHKADTTVTPARWMECRACHYGNADIVKTACADDPAHPRCIGKKCNTCHDGEKCTFCHRELQ